ncbi:hypothetical protein KW797_03240 [Candidatus Parcubacteria bacterium]|nr:hypothetical protein [Candidatus Parcubacteria bacterium]
MPRPLIRKTEGALPDFYPEFRNRVKIDKDRLDSAVEEQAFLFLEVCEHHVRATSLADAARDELKQTDGRLAREFRMKQMKDGEKATEAMVNEHLVLHSEHRGAIDKLNDREREKERWYALRQAMDQRSKMLRELVNLFASSYFTSSGAATPRNAVRDALAETARKKMDEQRRSKER